MNEIQKNPFLEGSEEVSAEEAAAAARLLAEEAQAARSRAVEIKEKVLKAKADKQKAAEERAEKEQAAMEATRAQIIRTISNIPKTSGQSTLRPTAPKLTNNSEVNLTATDKNPFYVADSSDSIQSFFIDAVCAVTAITFSVMLLLDTIPFIG